MGNRPGQDGDARSAREKRLAEALRANLKRRKTQQREREAAPGDDCRGNRDEESEENKESG
jgi:hypothetical protein